MNKKLKILFVSYSLHDGGAERVLSKFANHFLDMGISVTVILYHRMPDEYWLNNKVRIISLGDEAMRGSNGIIRSINRIKAIRKIIEHIQPNYVIPFLDAMVRESRLASIGLDTKIIATVRNNPYQVPEKKFARGVRNIFCEMCDAVFVQNQSQKLYFSKFIQKKTFVTPNPIPNDFFDCDKTYEDNISRFVTCGRLHPQKNHKMLIDAFEQVVKKYPCVHLSIYGVGPLSHELLSYIVEKGMIENVHCMGRTDDVIQVLLAQDCFILSSDFEGMPNALMEALALGLPCISTDCQTGPSDLIQQNQTGILVPVNDVDAMKDAIIKMIQNPVHANQMGRRAREYMRANFSQEEIVNQLLSNLNMYCS